MRLAPALALATLLACSDSLSPEDFYGVWAAEGVRVTLSSTQSRFETSCWAGDLAIPIQVDGREFTALGTVNRQGGAGGSESRLITATGRITDDVLHLTIEPASIALGPYSLQRDAQVTIPGCP
jgi:hypothetical protein